MRIPWVDKDYSFIDYYKKSCDLQSDPNEKENCRNIIRDAETRRDYHMGTIKHINHAIQFDPNPNLKLTEARWEIYKITVSFLPISEFISLH